MDDDKYIIHLNEKTKISVRENQLYRPRWVKYFGSVEAVEQFIKNYNKEKLWILD